MTGFWIVTALAGVAELLLLAAVTHALLNRHLPRGDKEIVFISFLLWFGIIGAVWAFAIQATGTPQ